jgi:hypothetical protein
LRRFGNGSSAATIGASGCVGRGLGAQARLRAMLFLNRIPLARRAVSRMRA